MAAIMLRIAKGPLVNVRRLSTVTPEQTPPPVKRLGIVGAGQMGSLIAYHAVTEARVPVVLSDASDKQTARAVRYIDLMLSKDVLKGKLNDAEKKDALALLKTCTNLVPFGTVDFCIEAVSESPTLKRDVFAQLGKVLRADAVLATNTSSISITRLAAAAPHPANVIGMHFINALPRARLVELVPGYLTSPATVATARSLAERLGRQTLQSVDSPGFVTYRILMPAINEAIFLLQEGVASKEDIDLGLKAGLGLPLGPLEAADYMGLDTVLAIMRILHASFGDPKYRPPLLLTNMVQAGHLGRKTDRGFYQY